MSTLAHQREETLQGSVRVLLSGFYCQGSKSFFHIRLKNGGDSRQTSLLETNGSLTVSKLNPLTGKTSDRFAVFVMERSSVTFMASLFGLVLI